MRFHWDENETAGGKTTGLPDLVEVDSKFKTASPVDARRVAACFGLNDGPKEKIWQFLLLAEQVTSAPWPLNF